MPEFKCRNIEARE